VLDVGCGTGRLLAALVERAHARAWGVDASAEMLAVARDALPPGVGLKQGRAEALPFRDGWFERVTMSLVVHLVDRPLAFSEVRRVLGTDGRLAIATFACEHFEAYWLRPWFPSITELDRKRFPAGEALLGELQAAGFGEVTSTPVSALEVIDRKTALARIRGRHISTFDLLPPEELEEGTARAERELPERVEVRLEQLVVTAAR
jgi:SAM-dependent methyltransferase